jgi:hypothetical protein
MQHKLVAASFSVGSPEFGRPRLTVIDPNTIFTRQATERTQRLIAFLGTTEGTRVAGVIIATGYLIARLLEVLLGSKPR